MSRTDVSVCNQAIGKIGGEPIESLSEDTPLGAYCQLHYPEKRDLLLSKHRWVFAGQVVQLAKITPTPAAAPAANVFALPGDLVGVVHAFRDGPRHDACNLRTFVSALGAASDAGALWAEYTARKAEAAWTEGFAELVALAFAADLAGRRPNAALADKLTLLAFGPPEMNGEGGQYLTARNEDSRMAPQRELFYDSPGPLVEARFWGRTGLLDGRGPITVITG